MGREEKKKKERFLLLTIIPYWRDTFCKSNLVSLGELRVNVYVMVLGLITGVWGVRSDGPE